MCALRTSAASQECQLLEHTSSFLAGQAETGANVNPILSYFRAYRPVGNVSNLLAGESNINSTLTKYLFSVRHEVKACCVQSGTASTKRLTHCGVALGVSEYHDDVKLSLSVICDWRLCVTTGQAHRLRKPVQTIGVKFYLHTETQGLEHRGQPKLLPC